MSWRGPYRSSPARLAPLGLVALVVACGGGGDVGPPPTPTAITASSGNRQTGVANTTLAEALTARVTSSSGAGIQGVTVTFAVAANSGTVTSTTATTNADGVASTTWTVGTAAGADLDTLRASVTGLEPAVFIANVTAGPVATLTAPSGDAQIGVPGELLALPLVVVGRDQFGNPTSNVDVSWAVTTGGGSVSPATSTTGSDGQASTVWTIGPSTGSHGVTATVTSAPSLVANFSATAPGGLTLASVSPTTLVEGQTATLTGSGFSATASSNNVRIGGLAATVTASSSTSLTVTVPTSNCQPARSVPVRVTVGSQSSNTLTQSVNPSSFTTVAVGQQLVLQDPAAFCLQFTADASAQDYLIGVQSTSEVVTSLTPVTMTSVTQAALAGAIPLPALAARASTRTAKPIMAAAQRRQKQYASEASIRNWERRHFGALRAAASALSARRGKVSALAVPPDVRVGDVVPLRVASFTGDACFDFTSVDAVVRVVGTHGVWLEDTGNPAGGYTLADFQSLSDLFDSKIYPTDVDYFGAPGDVDGNGRIAVLITKEVNAVGGLLGFVFGGDLFPHEQCLASNEAEIFYGVTPDPTGTFDLGAYTREDGLHDLPSTVAHEFSHIIQLTHRLALATPSPLVIWEGEGQAVLAEEVVGHAVEGRTPGQNFGGQIAFNDDDPSSIDWYTYGFVQAAVYFGYDGSDTKVSGAPEQCSWLDGERNGPCLQGSLPYGAPWLLLRWLSDHYGPILGGEKALQKALINNPASGYANISAVVGVPIKTILAQWAATLYSDDRAPVLDPKLTLPSWNLFDVYDLSAVEAARLAPRSRAFTGFTDAVSVRAGSSAYFRVSGSGHPATAIRVRNGSDGPLPSIMQVFVVRLQ